jgi:hypothetical protein
MKHALLKLAGLALVAMPLSAQTAQTADDIIAKYVKTIGGMEKLKAINTVRRTGRFIGGGGFEAVVVQDNKRAGGKVREEFTLQGMTQINAWDGKTGWQINPFGGKKDPEALGEEEMKSILEDADIDDLLIDYKAKGHKVELVGMDAVEGTDVYKLKLTQKNGDIRYYYMDADSYVPIKIEIKRFVRGSEREYEQTLGDYKQVNGVYLPFSLTSGSKGDPQPATISMGTIEANIPMDDREFMKPGAPAEQPPQNDALDAAKKLPKKKTELKPQVKPEVKPPRGGQNND